MPIRRMGVGQHEVLAGAIAWRATWGDEPCFQSRLGSVATLYRTCEWSNGRFAIPIQHGMLWFPGMTY